DYENWSCAYDSLLTLLWNMFTDGRIGANCLPDNTFFTDILHGFTAVSGGQSTLEDIRDHFRDGLCQFNMSRFPRIGHALTAVTEIVELLFRHCEPLASMRSYCDHCNEVVQPSGDDFVWDTVVVIHQESLRGLQGNPPYSMSSVLYAHWLNNFDRRCNSCGSQISTSADFVFSPSIIVVEIQPSIDGIFPRSLSINLELTLTLGSINHCWLLAGVIYLGSSHFISCYITSANVVWLHDGVAMGRQCL
ncbi:hypothetical protein BKA93DRAFT_705617, partial [Sparassis latifolia]